jgi:hypothetical protein
MKKECCDIANFSMMIFDKLNKEDNSWNLKLTQQN